MASKQNTTPETVFDLAVRTLPARRELVDLLADAPDELHARCAEAMRARFELRMVADQPAAVEEFEDRKRTPHVDVRRARTDREALRDVRLVDAVELLLDWKAAAEAGDKPNANACACLAARTLATLKGSAVTTDDIRAAGQNRPEARMVAVNTKELRAIPWSIAEGNLGSALNAVDLAVRNICGALGSAPPMLWLHLRPRFQTIAHGISELASDLRALRRRSTLHEISYPPPRRIPKCGDERRPRHCRVCQALDHDFRNCTKRAEHTS